MNKKVLPIVFLAAAFLSGCVGVATKPDSRMGDRPSDQSDDSLFSQGPGRNVLSTAKKMINIEKKIIKGSCWDWVDAVYTRAGYPEVKRATVFKGSEDGPFADVSVIKPGDWVMHHNLESPPNVHSSIFLRWIDRGQKLAETMDYAGKDREVPGKVAKHCYAKVFGILRATDN